MLSNSVQMDSNLEAEITTILEELFFDSTGQYKGSFLFCVVKLPCMAWAHHRPVTFIGLMGHNGMVKY